MINSGIKQRMLIMVLFAGIVMSAGAMIPCYAGPTESQIKAAFIYNFIKFVEWPNHSFQSSDSPVSVCALGQDALVETLESLNGRTAQARKLLVRKVGKAADADKCHVIYIAKSEREQLSVVLKPTRDGLLTVGDMKHFSASGGIINFITTENRISFEINIDAAERAGLKVSSQILKLARIYRENGRREEK